MSSWREMQQRHMNALTSLSRARIRYPRLSPTHRRFPGSAFVVAHNALNEFKGAKCQIDDVPETANISPNIPGHCSLTWSPCGLRSGCTSSSKRCKRRFESVRRLWLDGFGARSGGGRTSRYWSHGRVGERPRDPARLVSSSLSVYTTSRVYSVLIKR